MDRSPLAKLMPACSLVWIWLMEGNTYSTGSSMVMMLRLGSSISVSEAYRVVVLPLPVGPAHSTIPNGARMSRVNTSWVSVGMPRSSMRNTDRLLSRTRRTQLSPQIVATVDTRMSISRPSTTMVICPSWGRRRSTMFMLAMIFRRLTSAGAIDGGRFDGVVQGSVDAEPDAQIVGPAARCGCPTPGRAWPG